MLAIPAKRQKQPPNPAESSVEHFQQLNPMVVEWNCTLGEQVGKTYPAAKTTSRRIQKHIESFVIGCLSFLAKCQQLVRSLHAVLGADGRRATIGGGFASVPALLSRILECVKERPTPSLATEIYVVSNIF